MTGSRGRGWRGQVPNEEVSYHERNLQDLMIEDVQIHVAKLTQCLAVQNMEMYCDIDGHDSESNFKNPYQNHVLVREQRGRDGEFIDEEFQHEEDVEDHSQCFVNWNSPQTYDTYINDENFI
jgi:hypothetical protein